MATFTKKKKITDPEQTYDEQDTLTAAEPSEEQLKDVQGGNKYTAAAYSVAERPGWNNSNDINYAYDSLRRLIPNSLLWSSRNGFFVLGLVEDAGQDYSGCNIQKVVMNGNDEAERFSGNSILDRGGDKFGWHVISKVCDTALEAIHTAISTVLLANVPDLIFGSDNTIITRENPNAIKPHATDKDIENFLSTRSFLDNIREVKANSSLGSVLNDEEWMRINTGGTLNARTKRKLAKALGLEMMAAPKSTPKASAVIEVEEDPIPELEATPWETEDDMESYLEGIHLHDIKAKPLSSQASGIDKDGYVYGIYLGQLPSPNGTGKFVHQLKREIGGRDRATIVIPETIRLTEDTSNEEAE